MVLAGGIDTSMSWPLFVASLLFALLGHACLGVAGINRMHSWRVSARLLKALTLLAMGGFGLMGLVILYAAVTLHRAPGAPAWFAFDSFLGVYTLICWIAAAVCTAAWGWRGRSRPARRLLRRRQHRRVKLAVAPAGEHHFLVRLPGNQAMQFDVAEKGLELPRLHPALDGLSLVQISDIHLNGRMPKSYFQEIVEQTRRCRPDLVLITGDLIDCEPYVDWLPDIFGQLAGECSVYFVLGNHDLKVDTARLRSTLVRLGMVDVGGRWVAAEIRGQQVVLAGNELPWIGGAPNLTGIPPRNDEQGQLRIALSHSPDQFRWARANDFDLLVAGHTHGGQICFPLIGPIFIPSRHGVRHAAGVFHREPTVLHVGRGLSGELPLRLNCMPELPHLVLHAPKPNVSGPAQ